MASEKSTLRISIIYKVIMAITGVVLVGFLVAHLLGNLLFFSGPLAINQYAEKLRDYLPVLWLLRVILILSACLHVYAGIKLSLLNKKAKPRTYAVKKSVKANLMSRTMLLSGCIVLFFLIFHLAHLTFKWTHKELFSSLVEYDVYSMLSLSFQSPLMTAFYTLSVMLLGGHLLHGVKSSFQTLGLNHGKFNKGIRLFTYGLSLFLFLGFISIPLSIFFRGVK